MDYKPLKIVEYMKHGSDEEEYAKPRTSYGTIHTEMYQYLITWIFSEVTVIFFNAA